MIIISIGIILVLGFSLIRALFSGEDTKAAYMHLVSGSAQMKAWGTERFFDLSSDSLIMQGDEIMTSADSKIIVEFFDGTIMRVDSGSDVVFEGMNEGSDSSQFQIQLLDGKLWFNKLYKDTSSNIVIELADVTVSAGAASIFEVENGEDQVVRVVSVFEEGGALADILAKDGGKVIESETVGVGQEIIFTKEVLDSYFAYKSPTVLSGIADDFKVAEWYIWNISEDKSPALFEKTGFGENFDLVKVEPMASEGVAVKDGDGAALSNEAVDKTVEDVAPSMDVAKAVGSAVDGASPAAGSTKVTTPKLTSVAGKTSVNANGFYEVTGHLATLTGQVSGVDKVQVNGYTLQKFKSGDSTWTYFANADYDLMKVGENIYEVYAFDASGNKSEKLTVKVLYTPVAVSPAASSSTSGAESTDTSAGGSTDTSGSGDVPVGPYGEGNIVED
jgi:hypothetical protein